MMGLGTVWPKRKKNQQNTSRSDFIAIKTLGSSTWKFDSAHRIFSNIAVGDDEIARCVGCDVDGGGNPTGPYKLFLISKTGVMVSVTTITGTSASASDLNSSVVLDSNNNAYVLVGINLRKYDVNGILLWVSDIDINNGLVKYENVVILNNNNMLLCSSTHTGDSALQGLIYLLNPTTGAMIGNAFHLDTVVTNAGAIICQPALYNDGTFDYIVGITHPKNTPLTDIAATGTLFCLKINDPTNMTLSTLVWQSSAYFNFFQPTIDNAGYVYAMHGVSNNLQLNKINVLTGIVAGSPWPYSLGLTTQLQNNFKIKGASIDSRNYIYVALHNTLYSIKLSGESASLAMTFENLLDASPVIDAEDRVYINTLDKMYCVKSLGDGGPLQNEWSGQGSGYIGITGSITDQTSIVNNGVMYTPTSQGVVASFDNSYILSTIGYGVYVGGIKNNNVDYSVDTESYNPTLNVWAQKTNIPVSLQRMAAFDIVRNKGYVVGGLLQVSNIQTIHSKNLYEYNIATDVWISKTATGTFEEAQKATSFGIGYKGYVVGGLRYGFGYTTAYLTSNKEWDYTTNTVTSKADIPSARFSAAGFVAKNKGYIAGGSSNVDGTVHNNVPMYDPLSNTWTSVGSMLKTRQEASSFNVGTVSGNKNYYPHVAGGLGQTPQLFDPSSEMEMFDPDSAVWVTKGNLPSARSNVHNSGFYSDNKGYIFYGYYNDEFRPEPLEYNYASQTWSIKSTFGVVRYSGVAFGVDTEPAPDGSFYFTRRSSTDSISYINDTTLNIICNVEYANKAMISNVNDFTPGGNNSGLIDVNIGINTIAWELISGDGEKTVYMKFFNTETSQESNTKYGTITLHTVAPYYADPTQEHIHTPFVTDVPTIHVEIDVPIVVTTEELKIKMSNNNTFTGADWVDYGTGQFTWVITSALNSYTNIYFKFKDIAGNESSYFSTEAYNSGKGIAYGNLAPPAQVTGLTGVVTNNNIYLSWLPL